MSFGQPVRLASTPGQRAPEPVLPARISAIACPSCVVSSPAGVALVVLGPYHDAELDIEATEAMKRAPRSRRRDAAWPVLRDARHARVRATDRASVSRFRHAEVQVGVLLTVQRSEQPLRRLPRIAVGRTRHALHGVRALVLAGPVAVLLHEKYIATSISAAAVATLVRPRPAASVAAAIR